jgi:beta-glucosidase
MMVRVGLLDPAGAPPPVDVTAHARVARQVAQSGTVLLRNERGLLPLDPARTRSVAVIGPYAAVAHPGGDGSSRVVPYATVSPLAGIAARLGGDAQVRADDGGDPARAAALAARSDVAVVVVGDVDREGRDRAAMSLPDGQNALVAAVAAANPRTVVVLNTSGPVELPWLSAVPALLEAWYPGAENGHALAAVLFGDADPSGRLPVTFPVSAGQVPARYPAGPDGYEYAEGLHVGYRGFDALGRTPLFPFGHGLSYTTFRYANLRVAPVRTRTGVGLRVDCTVTNTGVRRGVAVPQVYVGLPAAAQAPPRQLKAFDRVTLAPGRRHAVSVVIPPEHLRHWSPTGRRTAAGVYRIHVGSSSGDLPLSAPVSLGGSVSSGGD